MSLAITYLLEVEQRFIHLAIALKSYVGNLVLRVIGCIRMYFASNQVITPPPPM